MNWFSELIEPKSKENLTHLENTLELRTESSSYKIDNEIPIFRPDLNFEGHWENNATEDIPKPKLDEAKKFLLPLKEHFPPSESSNILDAGCGDGIHLKSLTQFTTTSTLFGIDISLAGLKLCKKRLGEKVNLIQASIDSIPFRNEFFDVVYSYGVIAYTETPKKTFSELVAKTKKGGLLGIWIFPRTKGISGFLFRLIRNWCKITGKAGTSLVANLIVPFMGFLPTRSKLTLRNASWKQCREIVMVNIAPSTLFFPEPELIQSWFKEFDLEIIHNDQSNPISIWGRKK